MEEKVTPAIKIKKMAEMIIFFKEKWIFILPSKRNLALSNGSLKNQEFSIFLILKTFIKERAISSLVNPLEIQFISAKISEQNK